MARRSITEMVAISSRVPRGHDGFWKIILELDEKGAWGVPDVEARTNVDRASVKDFVLRLFKAGIARLEGERPAKTDNKTFVKVYRLTERPAEAPRLDRQGNRLREPTIQTLWRTMKMVKVFTATELAELATTPGNTVHRPTVVRYVTHLKRAGVVALIAKGEKPPRYRLVRDLGARAPIILKTMSLYDPNAHEILGEGETGEVKP